MHVKINKQKMPKKKNARIDAAGSYNTKCNSSNRYAYSTVTVAAAVAAVAAAAAA